MLVCNVSLSRRRAAIAAGIVETTAAVDATATGNIVFATLVDDPANVSDRVDAYVGNIMIEAASAAATVNAGLTYAAAIVEAASAAEAWSGSVPTVWSMAMAESTTAASTQDAALVSAVMRTAAVAGLSPLIVNFGVPPIDSSRLSSGTNLGA